MESFEDARVSSAARIRDALRALEEGNIQIALMTTEDGRLLGTITDGDIRRALLQGADLDSPAAPFAQRRFVAVGPTAGRAEVLDEMQARLLHQIPVVDDQGRLLGVHLLQSLIGAEKRPNWAVVMAGGKGMRLRPLTETLPKPMIKAAGRPIIERLVLHLVGFGVERIFVAVNYLASAIEDHFGNGERFGCRIDYLRETEPLGTAGALSLLPERPRHPLLVLNGDLVTQFDVSALLAFHSTGRQKLTVGVRDYAHTVPFGVFEMESRRITSLREKPTVVWQANAGIYAVSPDLLDRIPASGATPMTSLIDGCLERGEIVAGYPIEGDWIDVGRTVELRRARGDVDRPADSV